MRPFEIQLPRFILDLINNMNVCVRTKVLLIDFYKTYEMFSYRGLIRRLEYYRVRGQRNNSINWMSNKTTIRHFHSSHNAPYLPPTDQKVQQIISRSTVSGFSYYYRQTFCSFIWHYRKTLWINCFCNHQTIYTLSTRLMSKSLSYFKAVTFCLLHFALKILLHFASKVVTFRVNVTFPVKSCYISR